EHLARWFAERVHVEPRAGGAFHFWGRFTFAVPTRAEANQRLTRFDPPGLIEFDWHWEGRPGSVRLDLQPQAGGTVVTVTHERPGHGGGCDSAEDFWIVALGNLRSYLINGAPALLPDLLGLEDDLSVRVAIDIDAPVEQVFAALSDAMLLDRWIARAASLQLAPGGKYSYGWMFPDAQGRMKPAGPSRIVELVPNRLLVTDWNHEPLGADSRVRWQLEPTATGGTRVTLTHSGFASAPEHRGHHLGWARYLAALKETVELASAER
ncbi:MAG: SRPBCC domain-containing protein, partial [Gemmatimonadetes bacterium]|nr:SRPBCC domain-containing protein [Gemmatimonadota bacterium]